MTTLQAPVQFAPWPHFEADEIEASGRVLASGKVNYWTGDEGRRFEEEFACTMGARHAIAMANGTVALEAIFEAMGLAAGDEVVLTPRTFLASASAVVRYGAIPVFADVDRRTGNLDPRRVEEAITPRTKAILAVHLAGWPCDLPTLASLSEERSVVLIEDCAQAHGAAHSGRSVGAWGLAAAWSFCQDKIMTTAGEGGMVTTDDEALWRRMWSLKDHGKDYHQAVERKDHPPGFRWLHESFGTNWRLSEVQSAVGRRQLAKLPEWIRRRAENAETLLTAFDGLEAIRFERPSPDETHAYYKLYVYVRPEALREGWSRDRIMAEITERGVPCFSGSCSEIYLEKAFEARGLRPAERLPIARELGETSLLFLVHPTLSPQAMAFAAEVVRDVVRRATR